MQERESWTQSGRRLSQVRERGGRGLLKDECWSFPPASEREARMDDPTPRSKKGRETECVLGGSCSQARALIFILYLVRTRLNLRYRPHWFHAPQYSDLRLPQYVLDFRLF